MYGKFQEDSLEGDAKRASFNLSGPVAENPSFRLFGNMAKTDADSPDLNRAAADARLKAEKDNTLRRWSF